MFGTKAKELLLELGRSEWLPPWNEGGIRSVLQEIDALYQEITDTLGGRSNEDIPDPIKVFLVVHHHALLRNKRCLLAYVKRRLDLMTQMRWEAGPALPPTLSAGLGARERQAYGEYDRLLTDYMRGFNLDLTADLQPPKELYIEVRALEDCGEVMTEQGAVHLSRGTTHLLKRADVVHLVRQGMLEHVGDDTAT